MPDCIRMYLSVRVLMVFVIAGVIVLLDKAKVFLSLSLQDTVSPLCISWEVTLTEGERIGDKKKVRTQERNIVFMLFQT